MSKMKSPENTPVWVNEASCKGCDICVNVCPSGTLVMHVDDHSIIGKVAKVLNPSNCIGCNQCELSCPDFAIYVSDKTDFKFAKLSSESKALALKIKANKFMEAI